jgi:hypothetical protein
MTSNIIYDYIASTYRSTPAPTPTPTSTIIPTCSLGSWGICSNAPKCNGTQNKTFGIQTREYIKTSDCIIPVIQEKTKRLCENICNSTQ